MTTIPTLRDAEIYDRGGTICMTGKVYGDARFRDSEVIHTTAIASFDADAHTISTKNTIYRIEPWIDPAICPYCEGVFSKGNPHGK